MAERSSLPALRQRRSQAYEADGRQIDPYWRSPVQRVSQAIHLLCSSKKGISSNQLHRILGVTLKTAWFMSHRIREAMRDGSLAPKGGAGGIVEIDETYIGRKEGAEIRQGAGHKNVVLTLVERGGSARSFHVAS